jgi:hypothetical protein
MRVTAINGNRVTFEIAKCSGTFSSGSKLYIKEATGNMSLAGSGQGKSRSVSELQGRKTCY